MAKQIGELKITGTIDDITFYRMEGQYYARMKSTLDGKRVKRDPRFRRTMQSAQRLALGSQLASKAYRSLPRIEQVYTLYKELKSLAIRGLKEGKSEEAVLRELQVVVQPASRSAARPQAHRASSLRSKARSARHPQQVFSIPRPSLTSDVSRLTSHFSPRTTNIFRTTVRWPMVARRK